MKSLVKYFIRYPIWANVLMGATILMGYFGLDSLKTSFFPERKSTSISIRVSWPGAAPEEVEEGAIIKIEDKLEGIVGVEQTTSNSSENSGSVQVTVFENADYDQVYEEVKNAVDQVTPWPADAEKPTVTRGRSFTRAMSLAVYGNADLWAVKERAEQFRDELLDRDGVSQVDLFGVPEREILIETSAAAMEAHHLTFDEIKAAITRSNRDLSAGKISTKDEEILIRSYGKEFEVNEIRKIILRTNNRGALIRLQDVANVVEQFSESPNATFYQGERAVLLDVDKSEDEDILHVANTTKDLIEEFTQAHPEISMVVLDDRTVALNDRIDLLKRNGIAGLILVILTLTVFLNWRVSLWVALGIPISFAGMFVIAAWAGITINVFSLFGMIIVVGILVDDAIVVAEQIFQEYESGLTAKQAAVQGTLKVLAPVFTAVLTTMLAFTPMFFMEGRMGAMVWQVSLVVIAALFFSLIESMLILPAHLAHSKGLHSHDEDSVVRQKIEGFVEWLTHGIFGAALRFVIKNKWPVLISYVFFVLMTIGMFKGQFIQSNPFPNIDRDDLTLSLSLAPGVREHFTDSLLQDLEARVWEANAEIQKDRKGQKNAIVSVTRQLGGNKFGDNGSHAGYLRIQLLPGEERNMESFAIQNAIRKILPKYSGVEKLGFSAGHWGAAVEVSLRSKNLEQLEKAKEVLKKELAEYSAFKDVLDNDPPGNREVMLKLLPQGEQLGFTLPEIASQIRQAIFGVEIQRLQRGRDEIRIWTRFREEDRSSLTDLENIRIRDQKGNAYPLSELVDYTIDRGRVSIRHLDGKREVRVQADMENPDASASAAKAEVKAKTFPLIKSMFPNVQISFEGRDVDNRKFNTAVVKFVIIVLACIMVVMMLVFRSYVQAFLIFLMIPLGIMGALWGHLIEGFMVTRLSSFGLIALIGIVINDSIVYVDAINRNLRDGLKLVESVYKAGLTRLRPILLTTVTTVLGLAPLLLEKSRQAQFLKPMAVSVAYGLLFGSIFILFMIPVLYLTSNQIRLFFARVLNPDATAESVEPAYKESLENPEDFQ